MHPYVHPYVGQQNQRLVDAHTEALQKVIEEYDKKVHDMTLHVKQTNEGTFASDACVRP